ncbi:unnamed protein product [Effrenium voratum]|nr:unnamed protein product [Effrenium voratum]
MDYRWLAAVSRPGPRCRGLKSEVRDPIVWSCLVFKKELPVLTLRKGGHAHHQFQPGKVKLDGFVVPDGLLDQLGSFSCLSSVLGLEVRGSDGKAYQRHSDGFYYWRSGKCTAQQIAEAPCEKDLRASFEQSSAKATVLALQAPVKDEMVLLPYRLVPQVYDQEEQRALRVQEARKSRIRMAGEDQICPRSWLCCSCNFVAGSCTGVKTPEIFHLFEEASAAAKSASETCAAACA